MAQNVLRDAQNNECKRIENHEMDEWQYTKRCDKKCMHP